ncbi:MULTISPECIES: HAMP domain-containing sensor histidine kinase [unclassified Streptomyces]|uniref:sensor histidine kinase n=1 Tax=unclassified Streptomyces TaxID=2593676 RepID=UPI000F4D5149|nr:MULTISPECIES: HAMP domain-containing sensor histidine kinase [unclassified Streptomyces]MDH6456328.1 two-component system OmpR family sensor kinase [Streptomyces sp. SAI-119]MDH6501743.1 two-component system OmpR family sensor kinase [Streptomyces sp. SAI-149]
MTHLLPRPPGSLRRRLVLGVTVLATAAVLASQAIGYVVLRSWLLDRVDEQLVAFHPPAPVFHDALDGTLPVPEGRPDMLPSDFHVYFYDASGRLLKDALGSEAKPGPQLADDAQDLGLRDGHPETVRATSGDGRWRVMLDPGPDGMSAVVALPLDTVDGATSKILWLNAVLLAVTVLALLALGRWVVRLGLMPLTRMESTAEDITGGRLGLRLPDTDPRTEIGRLGRVLNSMLDRLQKALLAREASEARLRRFVADAGHELRTPLTAIQGYAQLALRPEQRSARELQEANRVIAQNAERMSLLVDDLQLLATLDKEPSYRRERVDLLSLAADAVSATAVHSASHPVDLGPLHTPADPTGAEELDVAETVGDPHRLRQILENLLSNARTHTPQGTRVHVRVGTGEAGPGTGGTDRPGRFAASPPLAERLPISVIEVADEGPGLPPVDAELVFERFYRADPARSRRHGGSGLGLAIAATIAEGHGGRLELDTAPGHGCTFRLVLPAADPGQGAR